MSEQDRILVFIPTYNCVDQIPRVIQQFSKPVARYFAEVLVLDNGSSDGTVDAAITAAESSRDIPVVVARNQENYGLGGSHKAAFEYAARSGFTHVVILHGDDQGDIADIEHVLERGLHRSSDACMGARFRRGARLEGYSLFRLVGNYVFDVLYSVASRHVVTDMGSGLNLLARAAFDHPSVLRHSDGLHFNPRLLLSLYDRGLCVRYFPISWREEDQVSNVKMVSQAWDTFRVAWDYVAHRRRFRRDDHRVVKRDSYPFDVVRRSEPVPAG